MTSSEWQPSVFIGGDIAEKVGKLKQLLGFLFKANAELLNMRNDILRSQTLDPAAFMDYALPLLKQGWKAG